MLLPARREEEEGGRNRGEGRILVSSEEVPITLRSPALK